MMLKVLKSHRIWKLINIIQKSAFVNANLRKKILKIAGCKIENSAILSHGIFIGSRKIKIHESVFINIGCFFDGCDLIEVHPFVRIGPFVKILTGTHEIAPSVIRRAAAEPIINKSVTIERGCWIGIGTIINPGVTVAEGCVIASGSVVNKSTQPNGLYAGVPAKRIKDLPIE